MGRAFEFRKARKMKRWSAMAKSNGRHDLNIYKTNLFHLLKSEE